jgi:NAD(P)-dependent dehydrogenase (short-subunit alcohol dehydrogenase family)
VGVTDVDAVGARRTGDAVDAVAVLPADLRDVAACRAVVADTVAVTGGLDCLVNAAGVWTEGPAEETEESDFDRVLGINLKGLYFVTAAAIPVLAESGGCVVNISSDAGVQGNAGAAVYCASKGAVSILTKALALELAPRGVRVNAVCPGDVDTPMLRYQAETFGSDDPEGYVRDLLAQYPQGDRARFVRPDEVAELVWFLAQPAAAPVTGANLSIDFGLSAGI